MAESIQEKIIRTLDSANESYHRLVLLVGESGSGKTEALRNVATKLNARVINTNLAVSEKLLELTPKQRALRLPQILAELIDKADSQTVVLDNLEVLFDSQLKQDPLRLLQSVSRNRAVIASWSGAVEGDRLRYADMGHPEHRSYELTDTLVVPMNANGASPSKRSPAEECKS